jgi:hypothetical protein
VKLARNPQTTQHPNSFLGCDPHYAYKIISAPRAHDNIAELYVAPGNPIQNKRGFGDVLRESGLASSYLHKSE